MVDTGRYHYYNRIDYCRYLLGEFLTSANKINYIGQSYQIVSILKQSL